ncbi:MAG: hypothetical protein JWP46_1846 [Modestobacter sp.]|nr:hypothetical protein [Modestobacter sp.]
MRPPNRPWRSASLTKSFGDVRALDGPRCGRARPGVGDVVRPGGSALSCCPPSPGPSRPGPSSTCAGPRCCCGSTARRPGRGCATPGRTAGRRRRPAPATTGSGGGLRAAVRADRPAHPGAGRHGRRLGDGDAAARSHLRVAHRLGERQARGNPRLAGAFAADGREPGRLLHRRDRAVLRAVRRGLHRRLGAAAARGGHLRPAGAAPVSRPRPPAPAGRRTVGGRHRRGRAADGRRGGQRDRRRRGQRGHRDGRPAWSPAVPAEHLTVVRSPR